MYLLVKKTQKGRFVGENGAGGMGNVVLYLAVKFAQKVNIAGTGRCRVLDHYALQDFGFESSVDAQAHDL